jgi:hypothetical protein
LPTVLSTKPASTGCSSIPPPLFVFLLLRLRGTGAVRRDEDGSYILRDAAVAAGCRCWGDETQLVGDQ